MENWYDNPPCRGLWFVFDMDPDITRKVSAADRKLITMAIEICGACPVREACLEDALQYREQEGIRAGLSPRQRMRLVPAHVKSWSDRQLEVSQKRRDEVVRRQSQHGFNSPAWSRGCHCGECSALSTRAKEEKARAAREARQDAKP